MTVNVEVTKSGNENNLSIIRKFTKRVQGSGILLSLRNRRYSTRNISEYIKKKRTLKRIARHKELAEAIKMGKAPFKV